MLTSKQKKFLRAKANSLSPVVIIGKDGLTENVNQSLLTSLVAHELVKASVLKTCPDPVVQIALDASSFTHSEVVSILGRTIVFYKKSKNSRIILP